MQEAPLKTLQGDTTFTDVVFICDDMKEIQTHKIVLRSASQCFQEQAWKTTKLATIIDSERYSVLTAVAYRKSYLPSSDRGCSR